MSTDTLQTRPKMRYVCDELEKLAVELGPHAQLPTMIQLRDSLGVSMKTLHDSLRQMEKRNILRSVHGVGIFVEGQETRPPTGNIGFIVAANQNTIQDLTYFGLLTAGIRHEANLRKQDLLLLDNSVPFENWDKLDGLIFSEMLDPKDGVPPLQHAPEWLPRVSILNQWPGVTSVTSDDRHGTYLLTQHLLRQGHRKIAYLASQYHGIATIKSRYEGYTAALSEAGIALDPDWLCEVRFRPEWGAQSDWSFLGGQFYMERWLNRNWAEVGCTAIIAQNDQIAYGAIAALTKAGVGVPEQVSVAGYDGIPNVNTLLPSLTTIRVPLFEIGRQAARSLVQLIEDPKTSAPDVLLPVEIVTGESSAAPRP